MLGKIFVCLLKINISLLDFKHVLPDWNSEEYITG